MLSSTICWLTIAFSLLSFVAGARVAIPAPNGTYTVGWAVTAMNNTDSIQPFTTRVEAPALMLSIFYPSVARETVEVPYMDRETAIFQGLALAQQTGLASNAETFQQLSLQLAPNGSGIAQSTGKGGWPVLIFGCALGTTRLFYSALLSEVASRGYVVIAYDTPYDTNIIFYPNGQKITANATVNAAFNIPGAADAATMLQLANEDANIRAQDASFIISAFSNSSFAASMIPDCKSCLNMTHVGYFGHSVGGSTAATLMRNDTRVAGGIDFDGAVSGLVIEQGFDQPFLLMAVPGQTRDGPEAKTLGTNWAALWSHLRGPSFDLIINNALHYTYSDYPLVLQLLGLPLANETLLSKLQITTMNGTRAHHIVTTYAVTFFDWLLKGASDELLKSPSQEFPEVSIDTGATQEFSNGTVTSATNGTVIETGGEGAPAFKNAASRHPEIDWFWPSLCLVGLMFVAQSAL